MIIAQPFFGDTFQSPVIQPVADPVFPIAFASAGTPVQITTSVPHTFTTGQKVRIWGNDGDTALLPNYGNFVITKIDALNFTLNGSAGLLLTSGGFVSATIDGTSATNVKCEIRQTHATSDPVLVAGTLVWDQQNVFLHHFTFDQVALWTTLVPGLPGNTYAIIAYYTDASGKVATSLSDEIQILAR